MFIELVDSLRCVHTHEESWLVLSATRMVARHVLDGTLGCPVCGAEFPVADGIVHLGDAQRAPELTSPDDAPQQGLRLAALLALDEPQGFALLGGTWGRHASELRGVVPVQLVLLNPPMGVEAGPGVSVLLAPPGLVPLAAASLRGAAIDEATRLAMPALLRAVRTKGRLLAPVQLPVPAEAEELARDEAQWVAEVRVTTSPLVTLAGARRRGS